MSIPGALWATKTHISGQVLRGPVLGGVLCLLSCFKGIPSLCGGRVLMVGRRIKAAFHDCCLQKVLVCLLYWVQDESALPFPGML